MWSIWEKALQFPHAHHLFARADVGTVAATLTDTVPSADFACPSLDDGLDPPMISVATWRPSKGESFPNPWTNLPNFLPGDRSRKQPRDFLLTLFPVELIPYIAAFLPEIRLSRSR